LDAYERQADSIAPELDRYADRSRRAAALWVATLGFGVSRALRRLLARARQPLLGWDLSAAIVCKPQLVASLRKGMVSYDTVVGAAMIVVLIALFPQDRIGFLLLLAVWGGICAFAATARRNFASYSAALAGYTAAIIAADTVGATGASPLGRKLRFRQSRRCRNLSMRNGQWHRKKPLALTSHRWPSAAVKERSGKSRRFARTERRGFEPRTSTVQAPARLTGAASRSSAARRRRRRQLEPGLSPKPVPAPAECDRFAPRSAMAAWRKYRSLPEGAPNGSNRPRSAPSRWVL
jgi:hypothetical protein